MDKLNDYCLKKLNKTVVNQVDHEQIVAQMEKRFPLTRQVFENAPEVAKYFALLLPIEEPNIERLSHLTFIGNFIFKFDDQIEKNPGFGTRLIQLMDGEFEASNDSEIEMLYANVIKGVLDSMDEVFKHRILTALIECARNMVDEHSINFKEITLEDYMTFRSFSNCNDYFVFGIDYGLNVVLEPELRESPLMKELEENSYFFFNVVQDMYSYKKELAQGYSDVNYVTLKMAKHGIGLVECVDLLIKELDETETKISDILNKLLVSNPGITELYFKSYSNLLSFFVYIHKVIKRYNPQ